MKIGDKLVCKRSNWENIIVDHHYTISNITNGWICINDRCFSFIHIYNYFYTNQELRKNKIKKLSNF